ncbi:MAG: acyltransferase family protein [Ilumatobacteraceae bacterium]
MADPQHDAWGYRPAIDGMRTIAIYLVVLFHAGLARFSNGFIGVDVFFVLSGYLVTNVMLQEHRSSGRIRLRRFYARRVRRLLPAAAVLVVAVCLASQLVLPRLTRAGYVSDARAALLYVANWHFLGSSTGYFAEGADPSPFTHFWSLAIEEQFYVVYPLALVGLLALARKRGRPRWVPVGLGVLFVLSLARQLWVAPSDPNHAYYATEARLYQLLAGACLAAGWSVVAPLRAVAVRRLGRLSVGGLVGWVAMAATVMIGTDAVDLSVSVRGIVAAALAVLLITALELAPSATPSRVLAQPTPVYLGRISYGTYLWHWPLIVLADVVLDLSSVQMAIVAGVGATALSALSFQLLETPIRRAKVLDPRPRTIVAAGLVCSVALAAFVVGPVLRSHARPALAARATVAAPLTGTTAAAALAVPAPTSLDMSVTDLADYPPSCSEDKPRACVLHEGSGLKVHLIGDSNALMLMPMFLQLAEQYDFTFSVTMRIGCPWQDGLGWGADDPKLVSGCVKARDQWYDTVIPGLDPDVIVAIHVPRDEATRADAWFEPLDDGDSRSIDEVVADTTSASLDRLTENGARVVLLEPLPYDRQDPSKCLSGADTVRDCAYEANAAPFPTEEIYRTVDAARTNVVSIDADRMACPLLPVCVPLIDGELVFHNRFHLSNQWVVLHADAWWQLLVDSGVLDDLWAA